MDANEIPRPLDEPWYTQAACIGQYTELWFPERKAYVAGHPSGDAAKKICDKCPVRVECLADALAEERGALKRYGIRGGLSAKERMHLQKQLSIYNQKKRVSA